MILELNSAFTSIVYTDSNHTYVDTSTGEALTSVTTLLKNLKEPYQTSYWTVVKALERSGYPVKFEHNRRKNGFSINGVKYTTDTCKLDEFEFTTTPQEIKQEWDMLAKVGTTLGTFLHDSNENRFYRKELDQPLPEFLTGMSTSKAVDYLRNRNTLSKMSEEFYRNMIDQGYIPIVMEFVVGDPENRLAGTLDALFYNSQSEEYELWDYKTDKEIKFTNNYGQMIQGFNVQDCENEKYSIQVGIYKYILEKYTSIKIPSCFIAHFNYRTGVTEILKAIDYDDKIKEYFNGKDKSMDK